MNLPVANVETAATYYEQMMGFTIVDQIDEPIKKVVLERDGIQMALAENGGDPEQDGCAFQTNNVEDLREEFVGNGLERTGIVGNETRDGGSNFKVFFVVAPDGLCYWFGERVS